MIGGLVLAAGAGTRFGGRKQLAELDGVPLLEHVLREMARAPLDRVAVVVGSGAQAVLRGVERHGAMVVVCRDWEEGQAASLRAGLAALGGCDAAVVVLGDQPRVSAAAVGRVVRERAAGAPAVRATYGGEPGHPVLIERELFAAAGTLRGDTGARDLLESVDVRLVPCDGLGRPDDVDTREQLEAFRARR
jgi:CTP:molybdopterin cytidylyltransferase MocA